MLIGSLILLIILVYKFTTVSRVLLFWLAFVLTRPFGATFGDLLTKPAEHGGLNFGTIGSSAILFGILTILVVVEFMKHTKKLDTIPTNI